MSSSINVLRSVVGSKMGFCFQVIICLLCNDTCLQVLSLIKISTSAEIYTLHLWWDLLWSGFGHYFPLPATPKGSSLSFDCVGSRLSKAILTSGKYWIRFWYHREVMYKFLQGREIVLYIFIASASMLQIRLHTFPCTLSIAMMTIKHRSMWTWAHLVFGK